MKSWGPNSEQPVSSKGRTSGPEAKVQAASFTPSVPGVLLGRPMVLAARLGAEASPIPIGPGVAPQMIVRITAAHVAPWSAHGCCAG